ncbi:MAG: PD-(D/E)XK nuclease family protein [Lachnospiraceae bacterium]|nr:PD-(D/E)XK nuclease family protein [Lachnospiraceae bacterium]
MLRFVFGASGAGKSHTVYREIIERSRREPDKNFLILVPDQFTMQTQREVVAMHPDKGIMNIDVLSFSRLMHRVFGETFYPKEQTLDDLGKTLVLMHTAARMKEALPVLSSGMQKPGFVDEVKSTISELMQYDIPPAMLTQLIEKTKERQALSLKLTDLQKLYQGFLDEMRERFVTPEELMGVCAARVPGCTLLKGAVVCLDGFTGFTPIQYRLLRAVYAAAEEVIVTLTAACGGGKEAAPVQEELFALSKKTAHDFAYHMYLEEQSKDPRYMPSFEAWEEARRKEGRDIFLTGDPVRRLKDNPALAHLERYLFRRIPRAYEEDTDRIRLYTATTAGEEVRQTFRGIRAMMREDATLLYRDFAVILASPEEYEDALAKSAKDFGIPVYQDRTGSVLRNPLTEYLISATEVVRTGYAQAAVFQFLKSGLVDIDAADCDLLERYAETYHIRGKKAWNEPFLKPFRDRFHRSEEELLMLTRRVEQARASFAARMELLADASSGKRTVRDLVTALFRMTEADRVEDKLHAMADMLEERGDPSLAMQYRQIMQKTVTLFDALVALLGDETTELKTFADLLEAGFGEMVIGTIPLSIDRVMIGDLTRSRLGRVRHLFLVGAGDSVIPTREAGGGFLTEIDRAFLREISPETEFAPSPSELAGNQRLYLYMMLTRPAETLTISCAALSPSGASDRPSYLFDRIRTLFPRLAVTMPETDPLTDQAETKEDMAARLAHISRQYAQGMLIPEEEDSYMAAMAGLDSAQKERLLRAAFLRYRPARLEKELALRLYGREAVGTISRLEQFAGCAYAHFLRYGLRLSEEESASFERTDLGNIYHGVIEAFSERIVREGISWLDFTDDQAKEYVESALQSVAASYRGAGLWENERTLAQMRRIARILTRTVKTLRYQLQKGEFLPERAEAPFEEEIRTGEGSLKLFGRIDRIDLCREEGKCYVKVLDFKSGRRDFDISSMYYGLQLQLVLYMDGAKQIAKEAYPESDVLPAALLYYRVSDPVIDRKELKEGTDAERESLLYRKLRTSGIVSSEGDAIRLLDRDCKGTSDVIPVGRTKTGTFTAASQVLAEQEFETITRHARSISVAMGEEILSGEIACNPARLGERDSCTWCPFGAVCGFDERIPGFAARELQQLETQEAIAMMKENASKETGNRQSAQAGGKDT